MYFVKYPIRENYVLFFKKKISICRYMQTSIGKCCELNKVFFLILCHVLSLFHFQISCCHHPKPNFSCLTGIAMFFSAP